MTTTPAKIVAANWFHHGIVAVIVLAGVAIPATEFIWGAAGVARIRPARLAAPDQGALEQEESPCGTWRRAAGPPD